MQILSALMLGFGLSMDAFAVSVTNGICQKASRLKHAVITALSFGIAQGLMPMIGWLLGSTFAEYIIAVDHWIAFFLLAAIGVNMIIEAIKERKSDEECSCEFNFKLLIFTSIATSIDALVVGISFPLSGINTLNDALLTCATIAIITFLICVAGFYIGKFFGKLFKTAAQILGGGILICLGIKILLEHLYF